jgi:hypothetical protein
MKDALIGWKPQRNDKRLASARIRCLEPLEVLRSRQLPVELFNARRAFDYRVVVLQKLYDAEHLELTRALQARGVRVIFDQCDNHFYNPTDKPSFQQRAIKLQQMLETADVTTVSTQELATEIETHSGIVPLLVRDGISTPQISSWQRRLASWMAHRRRGQSTFHLVWYGNSGGSPGHTGIQDLMRVAPTLEAMAREDALCLTVISNARATYEKHIRPLPFPTRYEEWRSHEWLCARLPHFDVCILPFTLNPFNCCKSNNRLTLSLALDVAVAGDAIPSYREFSAFCILDDWPRLSEYRDNPELRREQVAGGKAYVRQHYSVERAADEWWDVFQRLL